MKAILTPSRLCGDMHAAASESRAHRVPHTAVHRRVRPDAAALRPFIKEGLYE